MTAAAEYVPQIDALVLTGMTAQAAFAQVGEETGINRHTLQNAYYRSKRSQGVVRKPAARRRRSRRAPARGSFAPAPQEAPATNGRARGGMEDLILRLKNNRAEHDEILSSLETLVAEHVQTLAEVRAALTA